MRPQNIITVKKITKKKHVESDGGIEETLVTAGTDSDEAGDDESWIGIK